MFKDLLLSACKHILHTHMHACVDACHPVGFCNTHSALQTSDAYKGSPSITANLGGRGITAIGALADVEKEQSKRHWLIPRKYEWFREKKH